MFLRQAHPAIDTPVERPQSAARRVFGLCLATFAFGLGGMFFIGRGSLLAAEWAMLCAFAVAGVFLAVTDARTRRLPDVATLPLAAGLLGGIVALVAVSGDGGSGANAVGMSIALGAGLFVIGVFTGLGLGDVKLALSIGLLLGWHSWELPLVALVAANVLAVPHAIIGIVRRRRNTSVDTHLSFGPYLVVATVLLGVYATIV